MRTFSLTPVLAIAALAAAVGLTPVSKALFTSGPAQEVEEDDETPIDVAKLPMPVQAAAKKLFGSLNGVTATQESDGGVAVYEVNGKGADGMDVSIKCVAGGQVLEVEHALAAASLPSDVHASLKKMLPGATVVSAEELEVHYYEVKIEKGGKTGEILLEATGRLHQTGKAGKQKEEDEDDEGGEDDDD